MLKKALLILVLAFIIFALFCAYTLMHYTIPSEIALAHRPDKCGVGSGREYYADKSIVICGLMRDCENFVGAIRKRVESFVPYFKEVHVLVVENDSRDNTRKMLLDWSSQATSEGYSVDVLGCGVNATSCQINLPKTKIYKCFGQPFATDMSSDRIKKMAFLRNIYVQYVKESPVLSQFDLACVMDMDLTAVLPIENVLHTGSLFSADECIDAVAANGWLKTPFADIYYYYDTYAFKLVNQGGFMPINIVVDNNLHGPPINVESAFGGLAIYKLGRFMRSKYTAEPRMIGSICEHVGFNKGLKMQLDKQALFLIQQNAND